MDWFCFVTWGPLVTFLSTKLLAKGLTDFVTNVIRNLNFKLMNELLNWAGNVKTKI
jgi:hypothetical protein